jgi:hypothetical protein
MAAPNPEVGPLLAIIVGGAATAVAVAAGFVIIHEIENASPYVDFEKLRNHLESKMNKKDTVNVQGTIAQEETI